MKSERQILHVIASQGYPNSFGKFRMQAWVENVNTLIRDEHTKIVLFSCGEKRLSYCKNGDEMIISKRLGMLRDPFSFDTIVRVLLSKKPSIAIVHGLQHLLTLSSLMIYSLRKIPVIIIVHGLYLPDSKLSISRDRLLKLIISRFRGPYTAIALSRHDRLMLLRDWDIPNDRIKTMKTFLYLSPEEQKKIDQVREQNQALISHTPDKVAFLYIGRLDQHQKRVDYLVKTFDEFLKRSGNPDVELVIVGEGPLKKSLEQMVKNLSIQKQVKIVGAVSEEEKWLRYLTSTAVILASRYEGIPRVLFEAFATGSIVIAPNICGLAEVIRNGVNGFLYNNREELFDILDFVATNKQVILTMKSLNRDMASKTFNLGKGKEEMSLVIRSLQDVKNRSIGR